MKKSNTNNDIPLSKRRRSQRLADVRESKRLASSPRFTFGVIADIQHADIPDGFSFGGAPRYYRHSLEVAKHAAAHFEKESVELVLNLGDIIDGKCQELEKHGGTPIENPGVVSIQNVLQALSEYQKGPIFHTYGNHELYNCNRPTLSKLLGIPFTKEPDGDLVGYRSYSYHGIRFVMLDTYDINILRRCPDTSRKHRLATQQLKKLNPNYPEQANSSEGMVGVQKRFVAFNGAVDQPQLDWLKETLEEARNLNERVVISSHQPILPGSATPVCLVWNYQTVLDLLREYSDVVVACFAGHAHKGGYKRDDSSGIHFRTFEAALENPHPHKTYAFVDVYSNRLEVRGEGNCQSAIYEFRQKQHSYEKETRAVPSGARSNTKNISSNNGATRPGL